MRAERQKVRAVGILRHPSPDASSFWLKLSGDGRLPVLHFGMTGMIQVSYLYLQMMPRLADMVS